MLRNTLIVIWLMGAGSVSDALEFYAVGGNYIYKFDTATGTRTTLLNDASGNFWGVAADATGNVYASDYTASTVVGRTKTGGLISGFTTISNAGWQNIGVAYDPVNNQLTVARFSSGSPTPARTYALSGGSPVGTTSFSLPPIVQGMDYDANGNLYSALISSWQVYKNGTSLTTISSVGPEFASVDREASRLYVSWNNGTVKRYLLDGVADTTFGTGGSINVTSPFGMTVADGFLFVANGSKIDKYDLSGNLVTAAWGTSISGTIRGLTVPEPATWLLGSIATAAIGLITRRGMARKAF